MMLLNIFFKSATYHRRKKQVLPSLKLTQPLQIDAWKMNFPFGIACFQERTVSFWGGNTACAPPQNLPPVTHKKWSKKAPYPIPTSQVWCGSGINGKKNPPAGGMELDLKHILYIPGDSIRDPFYPQTSEVTNNLLRGHVSTIPKRSPAELPGIYIYIYISFFRAPWKNWWVVQAVI